MKKLSKLEQALERRFSEEEIDSLAELLLRASEKGKFSYEEMEAEKEAKEAYEMPNMIRHLVRNAAETEEWNPH